MVRRLISGLGRSLITIGVLLLLFVGYQLWGTGLKYNQLQDDAGKAFAAQLAAAGQPSIKSSPTDGGYGGFSAQELAGAAAGQAIINPGIDPVSSVVPSTATSIPSDPSTPVTPPIIVPTATAPAATAPAVTVPTVTVPAVTVPAVPAPATTVPVAPNANTPILQVTPAATSPSATVPPAVTASTLPKVRTGRTQMKRPKEGNILGRIVIPRIKKDLTYVSGAGVEDLKSGPGHYPSTPLPGLPGNAGIACHRTTYGGPCLNLNLLKPGDIIGFVTVYGKFAYKVESTSIVGPKDRKVLAPTPGENVLTITTCHPAYTARQRLVVRARLVGEALDEDLIFEPESIAPVTTAPRPKTSAPRPKATVPVTTAAPVTTVAEPIAFDTAVAANVDDGLASEMTTAEGTAADTADSIVVADSSLAGVTSPASPGTDAGVSLSDTSSSAGSGPVWHFGAFTGKRSFWVSTLTWAAVCAAIWFAAWLFVRNRRRLARALVYTGCFFLLFLPALYFCFENLTHLLPENV